MFRFTVFATLGTFALIAGSLYSGLAAPPVGTTIASLLMAGGGLLLGAASVMFAKDVLGQLRDWLRDHYPNQERRDEIAAEASRLGLSVAPDVSNGLPFPFAQTLRSRIFVGTWRGLAVELYDYVRVKTEWSGVETREAWTCAVLPAEAAKIRLQITRATHVERIKAAAGWKDVMLGDPPFDSEFQVSTARAEDARRLLNANVRSRLLEDAPARVLIALEEGSLRYCCARVPIEERARLLEIATHLREALAAG